MNDWVRVWLVRLAAHHCTPQYRAVCVAAGGARRLRVCMHVCMCVWREWRGKVYSTLGACDQWPVLSGGLCGALIGQAAALLVQ